LNYIPWKAAATYKGHSATLLDCIHAWQRDARRGHGALGSITSTDELTLEGWPAPVRELDVAQCLDLAERARGVILVERIRVA
jgi:hypothetical protein